MLPNISKLTASLGEVEKAKKEYDSLRRQWKTLSDFIDKKRAAGEDVSDLMRNLRPLTSRVQQARKRYVDLEGKYGTAESLRKQLAAKKGQSINNHGTSEKNPFLPGVSYQAMRTIQKGTIKSEGLIHYAPGKERVEFLNTTMAGITLYDKGISITLWLKEKKYAETNISGFMGGVKELSRKKLGKGLVNGIRTTKYFVVTEGKNLGGYRSRGFIWQTPEGVIVKADMSMEHKGKKSHFQLELRDLKITPQKNSLFEIPKGFKPRLLGRGGPG